MNTNRPGFTLVELLVVISIIAVLISVLLPALGETKMQARRVLTSNNIRQLSICVTTYANDNKSWYPMPALDRGYYNTSRLAPHAGTFAGVWNNLTVATADRTIYDAVNNYGAMSATAHPDVGTPTWNKTAFTDPTLTGGSPAAAGKVPRNFRGFASSYALFWGFKSQYTPATGNGQPWAGTPSTTNLMMPLHNLVGDLITAKPQGGATGTSYLFTHPRNSSYRRVWNENGGPESDPGVMSNLCDVQYRQDWVPTQSFPSEMVGAYMGKSDGSVMWYPTSTMVVALTSGQAANDYGIYWKMFGGGFAEGAAGIF